MSDPSLNSSGGNPYAPQEPPEILSLEHADWVGVSISEILYGISIVLFFQCTHVLIWNKDRHPRSWILLAYAFGLFSLGTVFIGMNVYGSQLGFLDNRNFPGGPEMYALSRYGSALIVIPNATFIIANWLADSLSFARCKVIWSGQYWVLIFPGIMYLASISMGIMTIFQSARPNSSLWATITVSFALPYFCISTALNVILTILLAGRLYWFQRSLNNILGWYHRGIPYSGIITMVVESSALYAVASLLFIGPYAAGNNVSATFLPILAQVQIISPLLIISRVARRTAWSPTNSQKTVPPGILGFLGSDTTSDQASPSNLQFPRKSSKSSSTKFQIEEA